MWVVLAEALNSCQFVIFFTSNSDSAQITYKQNMSVSSILEAHSTSDPIHITP